MPYSLDLRKKVINYVERGGGVTKASQIFQVSRASIYRWLNRENLEATKVKRRQRKLNWEALKTINCLPSTAYSVGHSLQQRVVKANKFAADIFVSLHFNAFNGRAYGSEIFVLSKAGAAIAKPILQNIVALGYTCRGVKQGGFYVLRHTSMPAILIECAFVDNKKDMAIYDAEKMAEAIVEGLVGELPQTVDSKPGTLKVLQKTYLKPSTKQSSQIPNQQLRTIIPAEYAIADLIGSEEGHYLIRMADGSQHLIYSGHAVVEVD